MRARFIPLTVALAAVLGLLLAAPVGAAVDGDLCGRVTAFTAPSVGSDGSLTINDEVETIPASATAALDAAVVLALTALATADATTCLTIDADADGNIIDVSIAATAELCGTVAFNTTLNAYTIDGVLVPASLVSADAELAAILATAAAGNATLCADLAVNTTSGLITSVSVSGSLNLCGDATLDADSVTLAGVDVPLSLLDAEAEAVIALAVDAGADVCLAVMIDDSSLMQANLDATVRVCGSVTIDGSGNAVVNGDTILVSLLDADAQALLALAAAADGTACAVVDATSTGGNTTVDVAVTIEVCATVTAVTDDSVTIGGVVFDVSSAVAATFQVGERACIAASTPPLGTPGGSGGGPVITDQDTEDGTTPPVTTPGGDGETISDTAAASPEGVPALLGMTLLLALLAAAIVGRRLATR